MLRGRRSMMAPGGDKSTNHPLLPPACLTPAPDRRSIRAWRRAWSQAEMDGLLATRLERAVRAFASAHEPNDVDAVHEGLFVAQGRAMPELAQVRRALGWERLDEIVVDEAA